VKRGDRTSYAFASANTEVRVASARISPNEKTDPKGIVRFTVTLAPKEEREIRVSYMWNTRSR
jgi:hypothetical protein